VANALGYHPPIEFERSLIPTLDALLASIARLRFTGHRRR
jgi:hypothetical protein